MITRSKIGFGILILCLVGFDAVFAVTGISSDSIIISAMRDEMTRSINELKEEGYEKPFFISYTIGDINISYASATLGAITNSDSRGFKSNQTRVMVGDYDRNDENFESDEMEVINTPLSLPLPEDADYYGIRRSLWLLTNNVYRNAARLYKEKSKQYEKGKVDSSAFEVKDFSRVPIQKIYIEDTASKVSQDKLEVIAKDVSEIFKAYPDIYYSGVSCTSFDSKVYFLNSEGTETQLPIYLNSLSIMASTMSDDGEQFSTHAGYLATTLEEFPDREQLKTDIDTLVKFIVQKSRMESFNEEYDGPVLYIGQDVAQTFESELFSGYKDLIANREPLRSLDFMNMEFGYDQIRNEAKLDSRIIDEKFTVIAEPWLRNYNGKNLIGSFSVDAEGVIPPEKIVLVKNGIFKTALNGRTPTRNIRESNGHVRYSIDYYGISSDIGPGVIRVVTDTEKSVDELKEELLDLARKDGHDYAFIMQSLPIDATDVPSAMYKVSTKTGESELVRGLTVNYSQRKTLKRVYSVSKELQLHNTLLSTAGADTEYGNVQSNITSGIQVSFIVPQAMLFEDVHLKPKRNWRTGMKPIVKSPLEEEAALME